MVSISGLGIGGTDDISALAGGSDGISGLGGASSAVSLPGSGAINADIDVDFASDSVTAGDFVLTVATDRQVEDSDLAEDSDLVSILISTVEGGGGS